MFLDKISGLELDKAWSEFQLALGEDIDTVIKTMSNDPFYLSKLAAYAKEKSGANAAARAANISAKRARKSLARYCEQQERN